MALSPSKRVVFNRNPLFGVSVQVRFPPILRIQVEPPAKFQETIRSTFPWYTAVNPAPIAMPGGISADIQAAMQATMQSNLGVSFERAHRFVSDDSNWVVQLSQAAITMSCKTYPRWEIFREKFEFVFNAFTAIYSPPFATMVGLRYQNVIQRSALDLTGVAWPELLQPFIAAEFGCAGLSETDIVSDLHRFELKEGPDRILVQHGMATNQLNKEPVYSIDNNFNTTDKVELKDVFLRLDELNKHSGSFFRLCITDRLYSSLEPLPI
jgi:uncharacterized protein (TIGR04255 family)